MKVLLISLFMLFSLNPKVQTEKEWIGTITVYMNEQDEIEVHYNGNYNRCFTLYLIKRMYSECDSTINEPYLDSIFEFVPLKPDTIPTKRQPIKTIGM